MLSQAVVPGISDAVSHDAGVYRESFLSAQPFKHVVIENFFEPSFAEQLLEQFPTFDPKLAMNELGYVGRKAANPRIRQISPAYQELFDFISAKPFLELVSRLSGIPDLILDPKMYGGGTHDNLHGQELDPHVDFNYDEGQKLHRRLNLIVYLNQEWQPEWGGALEIHSNPRDPEHNQIHAYDPLFNRAVMFETNEYSWHGFPRINLPPEKRHLSRKSISIYLYTKDRPAEEVAPLHGTFYVQRPVPKEIAPGHVVTAEDVKEMQWLTTVRDQWITTYQTMELEKNREIDRLNRYVAELMSHVRVPLTGYALQAGNPVGFWPDRWMAPHAEVEIQPLAPVSAVRLRGWRPDSAPAGRIRLTVDDHSTESAVGPGSFDIALRLAKPAATNFVLKIDSHSEGRVVDESVDKRDLEFFVAEIRARHPIVRALMKGLG